RAKVWRTPRDTRWNARASFSASTGVCAASARACSSRANVRPSSESSAHTASCRSRFAAASDMNETRTSVQPKVKLLVVAAVVERATPTRRAAHLNLDRYEWSRALGLARAAPCDEQTFSTSA